MNESQPSSSQKDTSMKIGRETPDLLVNVKAEPAEDESMLEVKIEPQVDDDQSEQDVEMTDAKNEIVDGIKYVLRGFCNTIAGIFFKLYN